MKHGECIDIFSIRRFFCQLIENFRKFSNGVLLNLEQTFVQDGHGVISVGKRQPG